MTSRAKRLALILGVAALVAVIAGSMMGPEPAAAAKKPKDPHPGTFLITTAQDQYCADLVGPFVATGAIQDEGWAIESLCTAPPLVGLHGDRGRMHMLVTARNRRQQQFEVVYADGEYAGLLGVTGASSEEWYPEGVPQGPVSVYRTFEGSVPE